MATPDSGEVVIVDTGGTEHVFPPGFDPKKAASIVQDHATVQKQQGVGLDTALVGAGSVLSRYLPNAMMELATNPRVPATVAKLGRAAGEWGAPIIGAIEGGPVGALAGLAAASKAGWQGSRKGWFGGKLLQRAAAPVAKVSEALAPYLDSAMQIATGAQGALDLAQMAEPDRQDIGFMGIGRTSSAPTRPSQAIRKQQEKNDLNYFKFAIENGRTPQEAAITLANGDDGRLAELMNLYIRAHK